MDIIDLLPVIWRIGEEVDSDVEGDVRVGDVGEGEDSNSTLDLMGLASEIGPETDEKVVVGDDQLLGGEDNDNLWLLKQIKSKALCIFLISSNSCDSLSSTRDRCFGYYEKIIAKMLINTRNYLQPWFHFSKKVGFFSNFPEI